MLIGDDTYVAASPGVVAAVVADPARWRRWWPDLTLEVSRDRGIKGCQWLVMGAATGTAEIWLEPWQDGTVLHLIQRLDLAAEPRSAAAGERLRRARVLAWKRHAVRLKDELEAARRAAQG
jgi:hypothetical protein